MSQVWVAVEEAGRGSIPTRCLKGGDRCITRRQLRTSELPALVEWSLWSGLWPRSPRTEPLPVVVSLLPRTWRLHRGLEVTRDATAVAIPLLVLLGLVLGGMPGEVATLAALGALALKAVVAAVGATWAVRAQVDTTGEWILLDHVSADAAAAIEAVTTRPEEDPVLQASLDPSGSASLATTRATDTG